jgi:hypothetical protein
VGRRSADTTIVANATGTMYVTSAPSSHTGYGATAPVMIPCRIRTALGEALVSTRRR